MIGLQHPCCYVYLVDDLGGDVHAFSLAFFLQNFYIWQMSFHVWLSLMSWQNQRISIFVCSSFDLILSPLFQIRLGKHWYGCLYSIFPDEPSLRKDLRCVHGLLGSLCELLGLVTNILVSPFLVCMFLNLLEILKPLTNGQHGLFMLNISKMVRRFFCSGPMVLLLIQPFCPCRFDCVLLN